jgi:hypothetical protein
VTESDPFILNNLSIPNVSNDLYLKAYPNPVQSYLILENLTREKQFIRLFNAYGQLILETEMMPDEIRMQNMQRFDPGLYLLQGNKSMYSIIRQ